MNERARTYALERNRLALFHRLAASLLGGLLLFSGLLPLLHGTLSSLLFPSSLFLTDLVFLLFLFLLFFLFQFPFACFETFVLEGRQGFNTQTWPLFLRDQGLALLLAALLGLPLLAGALFLWHGLPLGSALSLLFGLGLLLQLALVFLVPLFLAPLFYRFSPLPAGPLRERLLATCRRLGFPAAELQVMDASRRSRHANAFFTGFGRGRRIVLFDTLLSQLEDEEVEAVLAHEIGHFRKRHVPAAFLLGMVQGGAALFGLYFLLSRPDFLPAFGFDRPSAAAGLLYGLSLLGGLGFFLRPFLLALSRRNEYAADAFAARALGDSGALGRGLLRLGEKSRVFPSAHPAYVLFHFSHPPLSERLRALERLGAAPS